MYCNVHITRRITSDFMWNILYMDVHPWLYIRQHYTGKTKLHSEIQNKHYKPYSLQYLEYCRLMWRIMCTKGSVGQVSADSVGRYVDRHLTDTQLILGRYSVDTRSILGRYIGRVSVECRSMGRSTLDRDVCRSTELIVRRQSADTLPILHRYFTDSSPRYRWHFEFCEHYEPFLSVNQLKIKQLLFIFK